MSKNPQSNVNLTYTISEFGLIGTDDIVENYNAYKSVKVDQVVYDELEVFAKTDYGKDVFNFSANGRYLQAKSYVGTIQTKSRYSIEILPKIYKGKDDEDNSKDIFLELLRILYKLPNFKHIEKANFQNENMPLLEIFISMFLDEIAMILKKGIKSDYIVNQDNLHFLKGKILVSEQIKRNYIHKERFYVEYDEYTPNRAENKLIKSTLRYLLNLSSSYDNIRLLRMYQEHMYGVNYSLSYNADFRSCKTNIRGMEHYKNALIWAKVFLGKESFSSFSGEIIAFAILYPMEKLFENYVEHKLNEKYINYQIDAQNGEEDFVMNLFGVRPDYIIRDKEEIKIVADAKWKIIEKESDLSQSDFYQLFAYKHIYEYNDKTLESLELYYPKSEYLQDKVTYEYFDQTIITILPIDMNEIIKG